MSSALIPPLSSQDSALLEGALEKIAVLVEEGSAPNQAFVKVAGELGLPPGQVRFLTQIYNTSRSETQRKLASSREEKAAAFELADAAAVAERVTSAGAIFVGAYSPVSLGDYMAGSNHVLPTGGCAHFSSGLGVHSFVRAVQVIEYDADALREIAGRIVALADAEGLPAHGEAVRARF